MCTKSESNLFSFQVKLTLYKKSTCNAKQENNIKTLNKKHDRTVLLMGS